VNYLRLPQWHSRRLTVYRQFRNSCKIKRLAVQTTLQLALTPIVGSVFRTVLPQTHHLMSCIIGMTLLLNMCQFLCRINRTGVLKYQARYRSRGCRRVITGLIPNLVVRCYHGISDIRRSNYDTPRMRLPTRQTLFTDVNTGN
jgi:hypothetical protein